jgi:hypothetical protein
MRELRNLASVIESAKEWNLAEEQLIELVSKVRVTWEWGRSDLELAAETNTEKKWTN